MKKRLLIIALVLVIACAMLAGTMASYVKSGSVAANVDLKKFEFTVVGDQENTWNLKIAPGESKHYPVSLANFAGSNTSETDMAISALATSIGSLPADLRLTVSFEYTDQYGVQTYSNFLTINGSALTLTNLPKNVPTTLPIDLYFYWDDNNSSNPALSDEQHTAFQGQSADVTITFSAKNVNPDWNN